MAEILHFTPKAELSAQNNLSLFIDSCRRDLTVFGKDLQWAEWHWPKAGQFTKIGTNGRAAREEDALDPAFRDFAKAYFRYQQGHKPTKTKWELSALRALEVALLQVTGAGDLSGMSIAVLDEAAKVARDHYSRGAAYHAGRELERLAGFVSSKRFLSCNVSGWRSPIRKPDEQRRTGAAAKALREKKLPSQEALDALAEVFANNPSEPRDIFTSATFAMTMCAPVRITEILELPQDCEVEEQDRNGIIRYGWRFWSGKGYGADIKWIPTEMVPTAKTAVARIRALTEPARRLALWMEERPNDFYRHDGCPRVRDDEPLTAEQICDALGRSYETSRASSVVADVQKGVGQGDITLNDLWQYLKKDQPSDFPWLSEKKKIKYSNALFCMTSNLLHRQRGNTPVVLWKPTHNIYNNDLSPREDVKNHQSLFDRYGYSSIDGSRLKLTSHQARHLLNTIAQRGGLSELQIAQWSGRADVKQNRTYNHVSEEEMVAKALTLDPSLGLFGPVGAVPVNLPSTIEEFNALEKGYAHVTEFGYCVHDYTMTPCQNYRDCLSCEEQVCVKGNEERTERIRKRLVEVEQQFSAAERAMKEGWAGADRWYEHHLSIVERLRGLVAVLDDPNVQSGALIRLKNQKMFSPVRRALEARVPTGGAKLETRNRKLLGAGNG